MKNIIITGTSRGIGFELVQQLASQGHNILALSRYTVPIEALKLPKVHYFPFDITLATDREAVAQFVKEQWKKVDILIHNAGKLINKPFEALTETDFLEIYKVNVFGVAHLKKQQLLIMDMPNYSLIISLFLLIFYLLLM